jgi:hypothetical protein
MSDYPEHDKLEAVKDQSQAIGEFLENGRWTLCEWDDRTGRFWSIRGDVNRVLAEYFEIDLDKLEAEKRQMLDAMRAANSART